MRWVDGVKCPYKDCTANEFNDNTNKIYAYSNGKDFKCSCCKRRFSYKTGTVLENSKIAMRKWLMAMYIFTAHKKGISSVQLAKDIGVTQKTAWFMLNRLRHASQMFFGAKFSGTVEADEVYIGGKEGNKHKKNRYKATKAVVVGVISRESKEVKTYHVPSAEYHNLGAKVMESAEVGSTLITDGLSAYETLNKFYDHKTVNHSAGEYVRVEENLARKAVKIHTNNIEGYWAQVRRSIYGIYHWVSKKHLQKYLNECSFRFNSRFTTDSCRFTFFLTNTSKKLSYKQLIA